MATARQIMLMDGSGVRAAADLWFANNRYKLGPNTYGTPDAVPGWSYSGSVSGTGATVRTAANSAGLIIPFANGVPRITDLGFLVEAATTNLLINSNSFSTMTNTTTTSVQNAPDPSGGLAAWTITQTGANGSASRVQQNATVANDSTVYTASVFIPKSAGPPSVYPALEIQLLGGTGVDGAFVLNTQTGVATGHSGNAGTVSAAVDSYGSFWRLKVTVANNSTGNVTKAVCFYPAFNSNGGSGFSTVSGGASVFAFSQSQAGANASSYIPTGSAAVTRTADAATLTYSPNGSSATVLYGTSSSASVSATSPINLGASSGGAWVGGYIRRLTVLP